MDKAISRGTLAAIFVATTLSAFAQENYAVVTLASVPDHQGACAKFVDLTYHVQNGRNPHLVHTSSLNLPIEEQSVDTDPAVLNYSSPRYVDGVFVRQTSEYSCYAAALATIWRAAGKSATEKDFVDIADKSCGSGLTRAVTLLQLLSVANKMETGDPYDYVANQSPTLAEFLSQGRLRYARFRQEKPKSGPLGRSSSTPQIDYGYFDWADLLASVVVPLATHGKDFRIPDPVVLQVLESNELPLWNEVEWHQISDPRIKGGIVPIGDTSDLVVHLTQDDFVIAGLKGNGGHIVVVTGVKWKPSGWIYPDKGRTTTFLTEQTRIVALQVYDPDHIEKGNHWVQEDGPDGVLTSADFILAFNIL